MRAILTLEYRCLPIIPIVVTLRTREILPLRAILALEYRCLPIIPIVVTLRAREILPLRAILTLEHRCLPIIAVVALRTLEHWTLRLRALRHLAP